MRLHILIHLTCRPFLANLTEFLKNNRRHFLPIIWSSAKTENVSAICEKYFTPDVFVCPCEHILLTRLPPKLIEGHQHVDTHHNIQCMQCAWSS